MRREYPGGGSIRRGMLVGLVHVETRHSRLSGVSNTLVYVCADLGWRTLPDMSREKDM
ncbi:hypothetical protein [Fibrella arboris]|uniref:hypothetical protein n=1 Tax=Fibrella arboris TaxID=3242486 RepID=UPI003521A74C